MKLRIRHDDPDEIDMTPMIDVIFLLVLFFMIASSFTEGAHAYTVEVPAAARTEVVALEQAHLLTITADGQVTHKGSPGGEPYRTLGDLGEALARYREQCEQAGVEAVVAIEADRATAYEHIMQVWNAAKVAGIRSVSFLVRPSLAGAP